MNYLQSPVIGLYLNGITAASREESVDQLWVNILRYYFNLDYFGIETQSRPNPNYGYRCNIVITNVRNNMLARFLFVENKRREFEGDPTVWDEARDQLEDYMLGSRIVQGNIQTLYGLVGIGRFVRFYALPRNGTALVPVFSNQKLHIQTDVVQIHRILQHLEANNH